MISKDGGLERDRLGRTALHLAAARADHELLEILLNEGENVMRLDARGNSALHYCGHIETVQCLVNAGANLHLKNSHGDTAVDLMRRKGVDESVIRLTESLMRADDDVECKSLLSHHSTKSLDSSRHITSSHLLHEFCVDLGVKRLLLMIITLLCLALYAALVMTGLNHGGVEVQIPIDFNNPVNPVQL